MKILAENLKDLIIEKGVSLREIERNCGVSSSNLSRYLKETTPKVSVAIKLCNYFECSLDYLLSLSDDKKILGLKDYNQELFLQRYNEFLKLNNISHYKLAQELGLSESIIRHWRNGEIPKLDTLYLIATRLGSSIDYLIGRF